jgi:hypothetical protein
MHAAAHQQLNERCATTPSSIAMCEKVFFMPSSGAYSCSTLGRVAWISFVSA